METLETKLPLDTAILEQHKYCCGVFSYIVHELHKKEYKFSESYIREFLRKENKEAIKFREAMIEKIKDYYECVPGNLFLVQEKIRKNTPFRPDDETIRIIMRDKMKLKIIPRNADVIWAERNNKTHSRSRIKRKRPENPKHYHLSMSPDVR